MVVKRSLRTVKNVISIISVIGILMGIMFLYFDYSAQLPFITVITILIIEYVIFVILVRRVRFRLVNREGNITNNHSVQFEMWVNKKSIYPFKRMEVYLCYTSKYSGCTIKKKIDIELKDRMVQENRFYIDNLPYGYTDVIIQDVYLYDLMGIGRRRAKAYSRKLKVFVMPKWRDVFIELPKIPYIGGDKTEMFLEDRGKDSSEQYEIREFRDGDKLRQIHWKLSSKTEDYMVRDSVTPIETNIYVFFDLCNTERINQTLENAVSVAYKMLKLKYAFYIAWLDAETMRMQRKLVSEEAHIEEAVMEVLNSPLYEMNDEIRFLLERFMNEKHEVYNLFLLS